MEAKALDIVLQAIIIAGGVLLGVSWLGLLFRPNPREAPTWVVWGLFSGLVLSLGGVIAAMILMR
jgi:hypothetical protein